MRTLGIMISIVGFAGLAISGSVDAATNLDLTWAAIDSVAVVCLGLTLSKAERQ